MHSGPYAGVASLACLLCGCCEILPGWPSCDPDTELSCRITLTNAYNGCLGDTSVEWQVAYAAYDLDGADTIVELAPAAVALNSSRTLTITDDPRDARADGSIDSLTVSIDTCTDAGQTYEVVLQFANQIPDGANVEITVEPSGNAVYQITDPTPNRLLRQGTAALRKVTGLPARCCQ